MKSFPILLALAAKTVSTQSLITVDLDCKYSEASCKRVKEGFVLAMKFLENALKLTNPINIKADYSDYTNDPEWGSSTLGTFKSI
ncbi:hypothetical protein DSO57_1028779 [Entomophthora muscae]|uniref:Uncharacterized protein n=1 Tax=Entomophthora muscae TaxID=34485 RepID=A0ACC2TCR7_9FUNG|nr:hypothetical protein DSO57_1028779 [Entomophthora muscae]